MYTLDTNAVIYYLKEDALAVEKIENAVSKNAVLFVSAVSEIELFAFDKLSEADILAADRFLSVVSVVNLDSRLARLAANIRRHFKLKLADSAIAATAIMTGSSLLTRNIKDFKKVSGLLVEKI